MERRGALCVAQLAKQKRGCSRCDPARTLNAHARHHAPLLLKMAAFATTTHSLKVRLRAVPPCAPQRRPRRRFRPRVNREAGFRLRGSPIRARAPLAEIASPLASTALHRRETRVLTTHPLPTLSPQAEFRGQTAGLKRVQPVKVRAPSQFYPSRCREYLVTARGFPGLRARVLGAATVH